ncbi:hypothetical protein AB0O01_33645 [Streptomyces sp. NPDC093252]|uniref:hypothetical protein n=1 Tax=Streptomyces sp. NPDC093252 TaxID=3154980 RepID=UPI003427C820
MTALLLATGCSAPPPSPDTPAPALTTGTPTAATATAAEHSLAVAAAPPGTPAATATPSGPDDSGVTRRSTLKVASYDSRTGSAVIAPPKRGDEDANGNEGGNGSRVGGPGNKDGNDNRADGPGNKDRDSNGVDGTGTAGGSRTPARPMPNPPAVGDVIASAPAPGAPDGLLARITEVGETTARGTEVETEPATLDAVLGDDTADGTVPVDPSSFEIDPLLPDVEVSWATTGEVRVGPEGATVPLGSLRLDVRADLPATTPGAAPTPASTPAPDPASVSVSGPASAKASISGFVQIAPQIDFRYDGTGTGSAPASARLGVSGDWMSGWALKGRAAVTRSPLRIPFAELRSAPVLQVGPVPVVVTLDLTCYLEISGDGGVTVDLEQRLDGDFEAGGTFGPGRGWIPVAAAELTGTPVRTSVTAAGKVRAAVGAEAGVGLYGSVGVLADLAPYLRAEATAGTSGTPPTPPAWAVLGGVDLKGTLRLQLSVFGTPVLRHDLPLGTLHREWRLASGGTA